MSNVEELKKYKELMDKGILSEEEYEQQKRVVLFGENGESNKSKKEVKIQIKEKNKITLAVYGGLAIIGLIMLVLGLFTHDALELFYYYPIYRLIDIGMGFALIVLGGLLFAVNNKN